MRRCKNIRLLSRTVDHVFLHCPYLWHIPLCKVVGKIQGYLGFQDIVKIFYDGWKLKGKEIVKGSGGNIIIIEMVECFWVVLFIVKLKQVLKLKCFLISQGFGVL